MLTAELSRLPEQLFHLCIISFVPVAFGLHHEDRNVFIKCVIIILEGCGNCFGISGNSGILNAFGLLSQGVNVVIS